MDLLKPFQIRRFAMLEFQQFIHVSAKGGADDIYAKISISLSNGWLNFATPSSSSC
jgi:hypothetical protein